MPSHEDLYGSPWQSDEEREEREERRRKRHAYWKSLLTGHDWDRIAALASAGGGPRLEDLDARGIAVGVCELGEETRFSGERIGEIRGMAVLVWMK